MRKTLFLFLIFTAAAVASFAQAKPPKWVEYNSPDGKYSVMLPSEPALKAQDAKDGDGKPVEQYLASASEGNATMMVGYFDYFAPTVFSFDTARDGMLAKVNGTLISEGPVKLGSYPGRNAVVDTAAGGMDFRIYVRFYDSGGRVYLVQHIVPKTMDGPPHKARMAKFFDSFKVTKK